MIRKALEADRALFQALPNEVSTHLPRIHRVELFATTNLKDTP